MSVPDRFSSFFPQSKNMHVRFCRTKWLFVFLYGPAINCPSVSGGHRLRAMTAGASCSRALRPGAEDGKRMDGLAAAIVIIMAAQRAGCHFHSERKEKSSRLHSGWTSHWQSSCNSVNDQRLDPAQENNYNNKRILRSQTLPPFKVKKKKSKKKIPGRNQSMCHAVCPRD